MNSVRRVLITGASGVLGRAVVDNLLGRGYVVAAHSREPVSWEGRDPETLIALQADLANDASRRGLIAEAAERMGGLDVLINNAAVSFDHPVDSTSVEEWLDAWRRHTEVNLIAPAELIFSAAPFLRRGSYPCILNVSSRGASRGEAHKPAYAASKAGLTALGRSMALALGSDGISVTTIAPSWMPSGLTEQALAGEGMAWAAGQSPLNRIGTCEEVAEAIAYLVSPQAQWASGAILDLNGASWFR